MFAVLFAVTIASAAPPALFLDRYTPHLILADAAAPTASGSADGLRKNLMDSLMDKFHSMNDARQGFFQDDISPVIAPYFPPGQPFAETEKVVHEQNLGRLEKFQGKPDPDGGTMYVTKFSLMSGMFSEVYVVLNFDFEEKPGDGMIVKKATAYIRGSNM